MPYRNRRRVRRKPRARTRNRYVRRKLQSGKQSRANYGSYYQAAASGAKAAYRAAKLYDKFRKQSRAPISGAPQVLQDYRRLGIKYGRKISTTRRAKKLTRQNINTTIYSLRDYGIWGRGRGAVEIGSFQPGIAGTQVTMPVHLWELTTMPQGSGTSVVYGANFYELRFDNETAAAEPEFYTDKGTGMTLVNSINEGSSIYSKERMLYPTYYSEQEDMTLQLHHGRKDSFLEKFMAKFILNGPVTRPVKWCIQLCQFSDEVTPGADNGSETYRNFWQQMAKPYGYSPIESGPRMELRKHFKVLKSYYCNMDSPESSEDHVVSRMQQVDFNAHLNRRCNYRWDWRGDGVSITDVDIPEDNTGTTMFSPHVHPKARVYIMVRALTQFRPGGGWTSGTMPSYDIKIDVHHKSLD